MNKWGMAAVWVVVAAAATTLTWQIVSAADDQVSDRPTAALNLATQPSTTSSSGTLASSTTTDTILATSSTTSTTQGTSPTSQAPTSSSTAPTTSDWNVRTVNTVGGTVVLSYRPDEVVLQSASPKPGFAAEIKKSGPPEVEVEFEGESEKFEVKAKWSGGQLIVESDQEDDG